MTDTHAATGEAIEVECELPEPPEKVWRALTVPEILAAWMMPNDIKPEIGSRFAFDGAENAAPIECEILNSEPGRLLRYSWREQAGPGSTDRFESTVTFVLARTVSGGTHLRIVHDGFSVAATPAVAMAGAGCQVSFAMRAGSHPPVPANAPCLLSRAA